MLFRLLFPVVPLILFFLLDLYVFQAVKMALGPRTWLRAAYWGVHGVVYFVIPWAMFGFEQGPQHAKPWHYVVTSMVMALYFPKLLVALFLALEDLTRLMRWGAGQAGLTPQAEGGISRAAFLSHAALAVGGVPMAALLYGIFKAKYDYTVREVEVRLPHLPDAFEGFTIAQISDLHSGSFDNIDAVRRGIELVNAQNADVIFVTGDSVNNVATELDRFADIYSRLRAPGGVYSVLGNHDYGDYVTWPAKADQDANLARLIDTQKSFGWDLLIDEHRILTRDHQQLAIIGVQNYAARGRFPKYGQLAKAYAGTEHVPVKLLLSHDPSHWDAQIRPEFPAVDITFSGHTHGMQFGVNIPGLKWSPVQYVYPQWAGLYQSGTQYLYVNPGFGFIGFSGRVGILPEITLMRLRKG